MTAPRRRLPAGRRSSPLGWCRWPRLAVAQGRPASLLLAGDDEPADTGEVPWPGEAPWLSPQGRAAPVIVEDPAPSPAPPAPLDPVLIRRSLAGLGGNALKCVGDFYGYLFAAHPELREMFPPVMRHQNDRLFTALAKISALLDSPDTLARYLTQLGVDHRKYGVRPEHYALVGEALIRALRRHCPDWDDATEAAWGAAYGVAADAMTAGALSAPGPPVWRGRVLGHQMRARDLAVLDIQTDQPLPYEPGQYVTVQHPKWPRVWRQFSIANAPAPEANIIQLHIRQVPGGWVSTALTRDTGVPDEVIIGPPVGTMTADMANGHDLLLVAGGVGLAPLKALAEDILARDEAALAGGWGYRRTITLFHGARNAHGLYEMPQLHELERSYPWLQVVPVVGEDPRFSGRCGSVADAVLEEDWLGRDAFIAGPPAMIETVSAGLAAAGMPRSQVHFDDPAAT